MIESFLFGKGNIKRSVGRKNKNSIWQKICRKKREDIIFDLRTGVLMSLAVNLLTIPITLFVFWLFLYIIFSCNFDFVADASSHIGINNICGNNASDAVPLCGSLFSRWSWIN